MESPVVFLRDPKSTQAYAFYRDIPGYPYLIGLHYKGVYMGYPYPYFCLCVFLVGV